MHRLPFLQQPLNFVPGHILGSGHQHIATKGHAQNQMLSTGKGEDEPKCDVEMLLQEDE